MLGAPRWQVRAFFQIAALPGGELLRGDDGSIAVVSYPFAFERSP